MTERRSTLRIEPTAKRQLAEQLPESAAFAAYAFIIGVLDDPHRVGKQFRALLHDRYSARRARYRIDDKHQRVTVVGVFARAAAHRAR